MSRTWQVIGSIAAVVLPGGFIIGGIVAGFKLYSLTKICFNIYGFKIKDVNPKTIALDITLEVKNPSDIDIKIKGYDIDVLLNKFKVASLKSSAVKILKADDVSYLVLPININHQEIYDTIRSKELLTDFLLKQYDKIGVSLEGKFLGEAVKIPVSTNIKMNYTVAEILKMKDAPSVPCITGKVKRVKTLKA